MRNVLGRSGDPEAIAAEARERLGITRSRSEKRMTVLLWAATAIGVFDLVMVSTSQVGPIEFAFLAVPVLALIVLALGNRRRPAPPGDSARPSGTRGGVRPKKFPVLVVVALAALGTAVVLAIVLLTDRTPRITRARFDQVALGERRTDVRRIFGGSGHAGTIVSGLDRLDEEMATDTARRQYDDCWSYPLTGVEVPLGARAAVCFDSADVVVFKRAG